MVRSPSWMIRGLHDGAPDAGDGRDVDDGDVEAGRQRGELRVDARGRDHEGHGRAAGGNAPRPLHEHLRRIRVDEEHPQAAPDLLGGEQRSERRARGITIRTEEGDEGHGERIAAPGGARPHPQ
jgi:hypothetical protein